MIVNCLRLVPAGVCGQPAQAGAGAAHPPRLQQQPGRRLRARRRGGHRHQPRRDGARGLGWALDQRLLGPPHPGPEVTQVLPPPHSPHIQVRYLHAIYTLSTQYINIIYTLSEHCLHTIYTLSRNEK